MCTNTSRVHALRTYRYRYPRVLRSAAMMAVSFVCLTLEPAQADEKLFPLCDKLNEKSIENEDWQKIAALVTAIKQHVDEKSNPTPYEKPNDVVKPGLLTSVTDAPLGVHRGWRDFRILSDQPPPNDSSISAAAAILRCNLECLPPKRITSSSQSASEWSGIIRDSVVITNGSLEFEGYIYNSIVITLGPIKLDGYIYNSLVISAYEGEQTAIDVSGGYINRATVVGQTIKPGSARECLLFGEVDTDDYRGAAVRDRREVDVALQMLGAERVVLPQSAISQPGKPKTRAVDKLLTELLASDELTRMSAIAEYLEEFTLTKSQVAMLQEKALSTQSDSQRILLWQAMRHARDIDGRKMLMVTLPAASPEEQITFLDTLKNPSAFDVPILIAMYQASEKQKREAMLDIADRIVALAAHDWSRLVTRWSSVSFGDPDPAKENAIYTRRGEYASLAQHELLRWLAMHSPQITHRLSAYEMLMQGRRYSSGFDLPPNFANDFFDSSMEPEFRAAALPLVANSALLQTVLGRGSEEHELVRLAAMKQLKLQFEAESQAAVGPWGAIQSHKPLLKTILAVDQSAKVRALAESLLEQLLFLEEQR
jgi:hypothetical protein